MDLIVQPGKLSGSVDIPGSKSHTIRAVAVASLADGHSTIHAPLRSADAEAAVRAYSAMGAKIDATDDHTWHVTGTGGHLTARSAVIDVANSGTSLHISMGSAARIDEGQIHFTGDHQIQRRPLGVFMQSLNDLGAKVRSDRDNGCAPLTVAGTLRGGKTSIEAVNSQFLSSLLMNCPLAAGDSEIDVPVLNEAPYINVTLGWLKRSGVRVEFESFKHFHVPGGQKYQPVDVRVPADFSSATFFLCAGALGENQVTSVGLDMNDTQGDKAVVEYLQRLGATVTVDAGAVTVEADRLVGCEIDLDATPDALPMMAVAGCFASGTTRLVNVPQARIKETDRIAVMAAELAKMGAKIEELPDGLVIHHSDLRGADVEGHGDHRVVMALAIAGTLASGTTRISTAEAMNVTFPTFTKRLHQLGAAAHLE